MGRILFFTFSLCLLITRSANAEFKRFSENTTAIYGTDEREFVDVRTSSKVKELSESIAMIVSKEVVDRNVFMTKIFANPLSDRDGVNLCRDEKFASHQSVDSCTGFLIGEDLLASAGHCFTSESDCRNKLIAFNVLAKNEVNDGYKVLSKNIYECKEIVHHGLDNENLLDYAVIRLKRKVVGRKILKLRSTGSIGSNDKVFMIGHPLGLPQVQSNNAIVNDLRDPHFFKATLDSFFGNSGSPVFNSKTFEVEGILVRGEEDFVQDQSLQCYRNQIYNHDTEDGLRGEVVTKISEILPSLNRQFER